MQQKHKHKLLFSEKGQNVEHGDLISFTDSDHTKVASTLFIGKVGKLSEYPSFDRNSAPRFLLSAPARYDKAGLNRKLLKYLRDYRERGVCAICELNKEGDLGLLVACASEDRAKMMNENGYLCYVKRATVKMEIEPSSPTLPPPEPAMAMIMPSSPTLPPPEIEIEFESNSASTSTGTCAFMPSSPPVGATGGAGAFMPSSPPVGGVAISGTGAFMPSSPPIAPPVASSAPFWEPSTPPLPAEGIYYSEEVHMYQEAPSFPHLALYEAAAFSSSRGGSSGGDRDDGVGNEEGEGMDRKRARGSEQTAAADHYNQLNRDKSTRHLSQIAHLRNFNNCIKACLINQGADFSHPKTKINVLDFGCGMGGDIFKWFPLKSRLGRYVGVDIAKESLIKFAGERLAANPQRHKVTQLICADIGSDSLSDSSQVSLCLRFKVISLYCWHLISCGVVY